MVKNITFNSIKITKIFRVTMLSLKYVEESRRTRNKLKIKVLITNRGFCRQTFTGLTGALSQALLGQTVYWNKHYLDRRVYLDKR